jgi:hypothetical protein
MHDVALFIAHYCPSSTTSALWRFGRLLPLPLPLPLPPGSGAVVAAALRLQI